VVLAFDYTEENFYGDVQGFWIYGWKGGEILSQSLSGAKVLKRIILNYVY